MLSSCEQKVKTDNFSKYFAISTRVSNYWMHRDVDLIVDINTRDCSITETVHVSAKFNFYLANGTFLEESTLFEFVIDSGNLGGSYKITHTISESTDDKIYDYARNHDYDDYSEAFYVKDSVVNVSGKIKTN